MERKKCPCCGFPTLEVQSIFDICILCDWEDDGQDETNADEVRGGPNGDYSLREAQENFEEQFTMYRAGHIYTQDTVEEINRKQQLMQAFIEMAELDTDSSAYKNLWKTIVSIEESLSVTGRHIFQQKETKKPSL